MEKKEYKKQLLGIVIILNALLLAELSDSYGVYQIYIVLLWIIGMIIYLVGFLKNK